MTLQELSQQIYADNLTKGYDTQSKALSRLLILSEVSEALEAIRDNKISYVKDYRIAIHEHKIGVYYDRCISDSLIDELADIVIRALDYVSRFNVKIADMNLELTDVFSYVIKGAEESIPVKSVPFDLLCNYILGCVGDVNRDDAYWIVNIMCIPPILAQYHSISIRDLEYIISEKMKYNRHTIKKAF